jgi:tetratricopeptide (TPR) repeat protein
MGAADLQAGQVDEWLREGIAAIKAGQDERARELLIRVVACDEGNAQAWLWLSGVAESLEDRKVCLENVIEIDPDNAAAHKGLAWVEQQVQQQMDQPTSSLPSSSQEVSPFTVSPEEASVDLAPMLEPPVLERTRTPVTLAAALLEEDFASQRSVLDLEPEAAPVVADPEPPAEIQDLSPISSNAAVLGDLVSGEQSAEPVVFPSTRDEFSNEYACPYCAAVTEHDDKRCGACGKDLWVKFRKYEERSSWLWVLVAFQAFNTLALLMLPFAIYFGGPELLELLGASSKVETLLSSGVLTVIALLAALPGLFSCAVLAGLYFRWRVVYWLFLAEALIEVIGSILAMAFVHPLTGIPGFISAMARTVLVFQIGGDFEWNRRRILLRTDRGLKSSVEYLMRADFYTKQKMWAMAVVHIRAAQGLLPDRLDCHTALAVAYIRLKRYDLAERALFHAKQLAPGDPRLAELETLLDELRSGVPARVPEGQAA